MRNVLVIAAHADDEVLGVGGTIALHSARGDNVYLLSLCDRSMNHKRSEIEVNRLRKSVLKVCRILGIKEVIFGGLEDEKLELLSAIDQIEKAIGQFKPNIIYTHSDIDTNQDHRVTLHATAISTRTYSENFVDKVYTYEVLSSSEQGAFYTRRFNPNVYVEISDVIEKKCEAISVYEKEVSAFPYPRSLDGIDALAKVRGMEIGVPYAEAFELVRERIKLL
ncbi:MULTISPECIES: PIG-L deacetylase family protein [Cytobacillus]|uniref:LmbE family N-acetylglucosaminyl deacetylase n=1 Tax=Cytobacillus oceanisediminis TaxID=665099 RepID=A0ABX3CK74_9BACI|nr:MULTISPECIES: PIG-L deacetylase family protein [Cytobacillus]OHX40718.1 hypothetical protein BBV17_29145 [Cytobacillus oceanisediminis]